MARDVVRLSDDTYTQHDFPRKVPIMTVQTSHPTYSSTDETRAIRYVDVVYMDGDDAYDILDRLCHVDGVVLHGADEASVQEAVTTLMDWDHADGDDYRTRDREPWGRNDRTATVGDYVLAWNYGLGYVSLTRITTA